MASTDIYNEMLNVGIPTDIAICLEPHLNKLSHKKQIAFLYWATGMEQKEAALYSGVPLRTFERTLQKIKMAVKT